MIEEGHLYDVAIAVLYLGYRFFFYLVLFCLSVYVSIPVMLYMFPVSFGSFLVFSAKAKWPFTKYYDLKGLGVVPAGRNVHINSTEPGATLGVWEILSDTGSKEHNKSSQKDLAFFEQCIKTTGRAMFVYVHGKASSRANRVRVNVYNFLSSLDFHVVTFDFRGFGDSGGGLSEAGAVEDVISVIDHVTKLAPHLPLIVWGHSLGTAISVQAVAELSRRRSVEGGESNAKVLGLVLESPFNNLTMAIKHHKLNRAYAWLPWVEKWIVEPSRRLIPIDMFTDMHICEVTCPILMMHAEDDTTLPISLAHDLYQTATDAGRDVKLVEFEAARKYGHKFISRAPELPLIVNTFFDKCIAVNDKQQ